MTDLLKELCQATGIPGREKSIIDIMKRELVKTCANVTTDPTGNVIGIRPSKVKSAKKIMIAGHMDEIGFVVSHIDKNGFLYFAPRGGHVNRVLIHQRVKIVTKSKIFTGIVEALPAFLEREDAKKVPDFKKMFIDVGLPEKVVRKEIGIGDVIVMEGPLVEQGDCYISKAFDNRVGCYIVIETMKRLAKKNISSEVIALGSAQEEVGVRGSTSAAHEYKPDIGIALDVTASFDVPGVPGPEQVSSLGKGVAIKINDSASISNHGIVEFLKKLATAAKIPFQLEILPFGGTDAHAFQHTGAAVCTLSVPTRYVHSPNEMIHKKDLEATIRLLTLFLEKAHLCELEF